MSSAVRLMPSIPSRIWLAMYPFSLYTSNRMLSMVWVIWVMEPSSSPTVDWICVAVTSNSAYRSPSVCCILVL